MCAISAFEGCESSEGHLVVRPGYDGGEPLIDPLLAETHAAAWGMGMMMQVSSNGSGLDRSRTLDLLTTRRPYRLTLSLYGATDKSYDGMTRRSQEAVGSRLTGGRCLAFILFRTRGDPADECRRRSGRTVTVLSRRSHKLDELVSRCRAGLRVGIRKVERDGAAGYVELT